MHRYSQLVDYGDQRGWVDLFTPDGHFEVRYLPRPELSLSLTGRDALERFIESHGRHDGAFRKHIVMDPEIVVDGDLATSSTYLVVIDAGPSPLARAVGRYLDTVVRCEDGRWRFAERVCEVEGLDDIDHAARDHELAVLAEKSRIS
jgi:hypothetical protein